MRKIVLAVAVSAIALAVSSPAIQAGTLIPVPSVPGSTATYIAEINNNNVIAGDYTTSDGEYHGFVGTLDGQYTTFDHPDGQTFVEGINDDGYITGGSNAHMGDCPIFGCAFLRTPGGSIKTITNDGSPVDGLGADISSHNKLIGQYFYFDGQNAFFYGFYGKGTKYRSALTLPFNTDRTSPRGYNKRGSVVGYFHDLDNGGDYPGFTLQNGVATVVHYPDPDAYRVFLEGINDKGMISGAWIDLHDTFERAFLFDMSNNAFSEISIPNATYVFAKGINNAGVVAMTGDGVSYIYCSKRKNCPAGGGNAIEILDKWIPATPKNLHSAICRNGCIGARQHAVANPNPAAIREAIKRDPTLQMELHLLHRP
ncbi:MAG TPA: hypothetical protein VIM02_02380 [Rhizomicrobium sp.]|jgi:hypothetical protein